MNCEDIALLLDDRDVSGLDPEQSKRVQAHLHKCTQCAAEWDVHTRMLATPVAAMRPELRHDIWQALAARAVAKPSRRRYVRPMLLGLVVAGAGVAAMLVLELSPPRVNVAANAPDRWTQAPAEVVAGANDIEGALGPFEGAVDGQQRRDRSTVAPPQRKRLVVLPTLHEITDQSGIDDVNRIRSEVVRYLRERSDLDVIEITESEEASVPAYFAALRDWLWSTFSDAPFRRHSRDWAVARHYGAQATVRLTSKEPERPPPRYGHIPPDVWALEVSQADGDGGRVSLGGIGPGDDLERRARSIAREIYRDIVPPEIVADVYASAIADARLSDSERLGAFAEATVLVIMPALRAGKPPSAAVMVAATELGHTAADAETRRSVWQGMGSIPNASAALPLIDALVTERDAGVRQAIARSLREFADDPRVRAMLEGTADGDTSSVVRREARWVLLGTADRRAFLEATLRDPSLRPEERLATLLIARETSRAIYDAVAASDTESVALLVDTVRSSGDSYTRRRAITALEGSSALIEPMLESMESTDASVRRDAFTVLARTYRRTPGVAEAVRRALINEPDERVRADVERLLTQPNYGPYPPP